MNETNKVVIITGSQGSGKTSLMFDFVDWAKKESRPFSGVLSKRVQNGDDTVGYSAVQLPSMNSLPLMNSCLSCDENTIGKFVYNESTFKQITDQILDRLKAGILIIDEIGKLELTGHGWDRLLNKILKNGTRKYVFIIRKDHLEDIQKRYKLVPVRLFDLDTTSREESLRFLKTLSLVMT